MRHTALTTAKMVKSGQCPIIAQRKPGAIGNRLGSINPQLNNSLFLTICKASRHRAS